MPKDKSTGKKLADMMYGNPNGAAFGITPMIGKRREDRQDREAAKSFPVDLARGVVAGAVGLPGDIESLARLPYELYTGNESPTFLPTSEDVLKRIPFGTNTPAGQFASGLGTLAGGSANLGAVPRAVKAAPGALAAGARNLSAPRTLNPQAGVFIGPKAKTWNQGKADMAVAMEEARRTPQEIWQATGTFRGPDGAWRQEIDDSKAVHRYPHEIKLKAGQLKEQQQALKEAAKESLIRGKEVVSDLFPKEAIAARQALKKQVGNIDDELGGYYGLNADPQRGNYMKYGYQHPELYEAYPELAEIVLRQNNRGSPGMLGSQYGNQVNLYERGLLQKNPGSTVAHELQHAIQDIEKTATGGNVEMFQRERYEANNKIGALNDRMTMLVRLKDEETDPAVKAVLQKQYDETMDEKLKLIPKANIEPHDAYRRLAGEAEARAVQSRLDMTPSERMAKFPLESYDVPIDELDIRTPADRVHFSDNPDVMQLELAKGGAIRMQAGGLPKRLIESGAKAIKALKPAKEAAVPLTLPRVRPTTQDIMEAAERVGKQQAGEFVKSPLLKKTTNLAGRSKKEVDRLKELEYKLTPIKDLPEMKPYEAKVGEVNIALPGDQTVSDMLLESVDGVPIGTTSEGGALFGRGRLADPEETRAFWASNIGPADLFQKKVTELAQLYDTDMVTAYHLAMGQMSNNFAQHMADANLRAIDYSKLGKGKMNDFDKVISKGYVDPTTKERVKFEDWPGIASPEDALLAMKEDPKLRKWFNNRMKTEDVTKKSDLPYGKSIEWAMTEPELRNMEINLTGLSAGRMKPGAELIPDSAHQTYSHDIPGTALGRAPELSPFSISFPDATAFVREKYRPQDFTGTIQKVFPHQVVDEAYLEDMYKYYTQLRKVRGYKKGGAVRKAAGGEITADDLILEERKL
jgi:hypothetical protein